MFIINNLRKVIFLKDNEVVSRLPDAISGLSDPGSLKKLFFVSCFYGFGDVYDALGKWNLDAFLIELLLDIAGEGVLEIEELFANAPSADHEVKRGVAEALKDDHWGGVIEREGVLVRNFLQGTDHLVDTGMVSDADVDINATYWKFGDVCDFCLDHRLVGDADELIVELP